jgi:hypothetical protein
MADGLPLPLLSSCGRAIASAMRGAQLPVSRQAGEENESYLRLQLLTIAELLNGKRIEYPGWSSNACSARTRDAEERSQLAGSWLGPCRP